MVDVEGVDLLDNTPIIDIKPYLPYADAITTSSAKMGSRTIQSPPQIPVEFPPRIQQEMLKIEQQYSGFADLVTAVLAQDPRPAYKRTLEHDPKMYKVQIYNVDIGWRWQNHKIIVEQFTLLPSS